ncbi:MAG TPA: hypothetical protein VF043_37470 [Ktedonobacteraceae bacterium]
MSHIFQLSDEEYTKLAVYAKQHKQTPEKLFKSWVNEMTHRVKEPTAASRKQQTRQRQQEESNGEDLNSPLFQVAGMFAIGDPGWADRHDEYLAEAYIEDHAEE